MNAPTFVSNDTTQNTTTLKISNPSDDRIGHWCVGVCDEAVVKLRQEFSILGRTGTEILLRI